MDAHPLDVVDEMFDLGVEMRRERARREAPELDDEAIQVIVTAWLRSRPTLRSATAQVSLAPGRVNDGTDRFAGRRRQRSE